jgi:hypothetical protein
VKVEEFEKLSKPDLRRLANEYFQRADSAGPLDGPAYLLRAQFYLHELDRREDSRISLRDLVLEIVVIVLIGAEIALGIWEGRQQSAAFNGVTTILNNLEASSEATAKTLTSLQERQLQLLQQTAQEATSRPDVQLEVVRGESTLGMKIRNVGTLKVAEGSSCSYYAWNLDESYANKIQVEHAVSSIGTIAPGQSSGTWAVTAGYRYYTTLPPYPGPAYSRGNRILAYFETSCLLCNPSKRYYWALLTLGKMDGSYVEQENPENPLKLSPSQLERKVDQLQTRTGLKHIGSDPQLQ